MNEKITTEHQGRPAYVYVRQSTMFQVQHNLESQRRQYGLVQRAQELGWSQVEVIDEDLGCSGGGSAPRKGFDRLVAAVCMGQVGAVLSLEASRLARNNRDWHQLVDLCGLTTTLIIDQDGIYDPRQLNDRLLLGLKGTMSEFELGLFRQRSVEALKAKARRGELYMTVPIGYIRVGNDRCEMDPDRRVQQALRTVFDKFEEIGSVRQVLLWFRQEEVLLPCVKYGAEGRAIAWRLPVYNTIRSILSNPIYAGAYAFGRRTTKTHVVDGRARKREGILLPQQEWMVLLPEHHAGYIPWSQYQRNQAKIRDNATVSWARGARGAARSGRSLVAGLLRCGRCGRKLHVHYAGDERAPRYGCRGASINHGTGKCISVGGVRLDLAVEQKVLQVIEPAGIEAAIRAAREDSAERDQKRKMKELALEQARYEADRARRQFDAVEPENRIVAAELEKRWNDALARAQEREKDIEDAVASSDQARVDPGRLMELATDLPRVWFDERSDMALKKRIVRLLVEEIIVDVEKVPGHVDLTIHWKGGQHGTLRVRKNRTGEHRFATDVETVELVRELATVMPDPEIARHLNRLGRKTGHGNNWIASRVTGLRNAHDIAVYDAQKKRADGLVNMQEAARHLGISSMSVMRLIREKVLPARQAMPYAPRLILRTDLDQPSVRNAAAAIKRRGKRPLPETVDQKVFEFPMSS